MKSKYKFEERDILLFPSELSTR